jgi:hypothetical protein
MAVAHGACPSSCGGPVGVCCLSGKCHRGSPCPFPTAAPTCALGAACSSTDVCTGGIAGCASNCQCLGGKWEAPCPTDLPQTGSACTAAGAECGYTTSTNACGADNCYCKSGAWSCGPSCIIGDASSTSADAGADASADACAPSGCTGSCLSGRHNVSSMVDGCLVWECCVPDDGGAAIDSGTSR